MSEFVGIDVDFVVFAFLGMFTFFGCVVTIHVEKEELSADNAC